MLDILYEDEAIIFVDKPPGIVVQRSHDATEPVLVEEVAAYLEESGQHCFLMQRLDRGTTGVIFFTKLASINAAVTRQFERKRLQKRYLALAEGELAEAQTIEAPLARIGPISLRAGRGEAFGDVGDTPRFQSPGILPRHPPPYRANASDPRSPGCNRSSAGRRLAVRGAQRVAPHAPCVVH